MILSAAAMRLGLPGILFAQVLSVVAGFATLVLLLRDRTALHRLASGRRVSAGWPAGRVRTIRNVVIERDGVDAVRAAGGVGHLCVRTVLETRVVAGGGGGRGAPRPGDDDPARGTADCSPAPGHERAPRDRRRPAVPPAASRGRGRFPRSVRTVTSCGAISAMGSSCPTPSM